MGNTRDSDIDLAGEYVKLLQPGLVITGKVRAAWLETSSTLGSVIVLLIECGDSDMVCTPPPTLGEVRRFVHDPHGGNSRLIIDQSRRAR